MWTCPKCNHKFYNKNQQHSCGHYTVADFLDGKTEKAIGLFNTFLAKYKTIGSYELHPVKTRVALLCKMRFASINRLRADHLDGHLVLTAPATDHGELFYKIDNLDNRFHVHHFRIYKTSDLDGAFECYMRMAYEVGGRKHVK